MSSMFKKELKQKNKKGFTLMEVMIAMSVIIIGLTVSLGLIAFTISSGTQDKDRLIAINLAQEGIELVRNIRDNNWNHGYDWNENIHSENNKRIDYNDYQGTESFAFDGQCSQTWLKVNDNDGYQYDNGTDTVFKRCINISQVGQNDKIEVISEVEVDDNKSNYTISVVAYLYGWRE